MSIINYINGSRKGSKAHDLEKKSMSDPFLSEAIDGYDSVDGNHSLSIKQLRASIIAKRRPRKRNYVLQVAAVICVLIFALGGYLVFDSKKTGLYAQQLPVRVIELYVPDSFYEDNVLAVEQENKQLVAQAVTKDKKNADLALEPNLSDKELSLLMSNTYTARNGAPIDIFLPDVVSGKLSGNINHSDRHLLYAESITEDDQNLASSFVEKSVEKEPSLAYSSKKAIDKSTVASNSSEIDNSITPLNGFISYDKYISSSLQRSNDNQCKGVKGRVVLEFSIDEAGHPILFTIEESLCPSLDQEAMRVVRVGPRWTLTNKRVRYIVYF